MAAKLKAYTLGISLFLSAVAVHGKERQLLEPAQMPAAVAHAPGYNPGIHLCWLGAYSTDTDPKGTNIRAAPSRHAPVIGTIPGERAEAGTNIGPEFRVIGSVKGWLLIINAFWAGYDLDEKQLFEGPGWIAASLARFAPEDPWLRSAPKADAPTVMELVSAPDADSAWGPSEIVIRRIYSCSGSFIDVDLETPDGRKARGWVSGACANQVTTCSGGKPYIEERQGKLIEVEASHTAQ